MIGCRFSKKRRRLGDIRRIEILVINFVGSGGRIRTADTRIMILLLSVVIAGKSATKLQLSCKYRPFRRRQFGAVVIGRK